MINVQPKSMRITKDNTHGARITCHCGWADKTYSRNAKSLANYHNLKFHYNSYAIDFGGI